MTVASVECEEAIAELRADPAMAGLLGPDARALIWELSGKRLLWSSVAAAPLARALAGDDGSIDPDLPFFAWLRRSGAIAPIGGVRLERVRLGTDGISQLTMLACRRLVLGEREALLTILVGAAPGLRGRSRAASASEPPPIEAPPAQANPAAEPDDAAVTSAVTSAMPSDAASVEHLRALPARRFVWEMDAGGRFTAVSAPLAEVVGAENASVIGRRWTDIVGRLVLDPTNGVADALAAQAAWSNRPVLWRMADGRHLLPVAMSGAPVWGQQRSLEGFRGFGMRKPSEIVIDPDAVATELGATDAEPNERASDRAGAPALPEAVEPVPGEAPPALAGEPARMGEPAGDESSAENSAEATAVDAPVQGHVAQPGEAVSEQPSIPTDATAPGEADRTEAADGAYPSASEGFRPAFQIALDPPMSGLSDVLAALPASGGLPDPNGKAPDGAAATAISAQELSGAAEEVASVEMPEADHGEAFRQTTASASTEMRDEAGALQSAQAGFGVLRARVGGQLGGSRPLPLRLASDEDGSDGGDLENRDSEPADARSVLSFAERGALHEIARALGARIEGSDRSEGAERRASADIVQIPQQSRARDLARLPEQMPLGVLVHRGETVLYANRFLLDLLGSDEAAAQAGEVPALFARGLDPALQTGQSPATALITGGEGGRLVECSAATVEWGDATASLQLVRPLEDGDPALRMRALELDIAQRDRRLDELAAVLELASDGLAIIDVAGRILSLDSGAERLFGRGRNEVVEEPITTFLAPESHAAVLAAIEGLTSGEKTGPEVLEASGRSPAGKPIPLKLVLGSVGTAEPSVCVVIHDVSRLKELEAAAASAGRKVEDGDKQRTEFLARLSHEIRSPLNAIIGFAEVMIEERFGPVGSERYRAYLEDIRQSGRQAIGLIDDLLDLARTSSGELAVSPKRVDLNRAVAQGVSRVQPIAARERIVVRTSFASSLAPVVVDQASLTQIVVNVLSHAIRRSDAGGQVIASTAATETGCVAFRVRDTGRVMGREEIEAALQPFRQMPTARRADETGLGLALAKALVEANRGTFTLTSQPHEGTLVEVAFPALRLGSGEA